MVNNDINQQEFFHLNYPSEIQQIMMGELCKIHLCQAVGFFILCILLFLQVLSYLREKPAVSYFFEELPNVKLMKLFADSQPITWIIDGKLPLKTHLIPRLPNVRDIIF